MRIWISPSEIPFRRRAPFPQPAPHPQPSPLAPGGWPPRPPQVQPGTIPASPITATNPKDGAEMIFIPAGEFTMGDNELNKGEKDCPEHRIYLDGYWMYRNDVTVAMYQKFCNDTGRQMPVEPEYTFTSLTAADHHGGWHWADHQNDPIVNVNWDDVNAYCQWAGVALPTEAEWEKAARGTDGRIYPWGNDWDNTRLQCSKTPMGDSGSTAACSGSFPLGASPYGVLDMAGNVDDWCSDRYDASYYASITQRNPSGPAAGFERVLRGGSWDDSGIADFRSAHRGHTQGYPPSFYEVWDLGFRGVLRAGMN